MEWTYLGHAMWWVEVARLRVLMDPVLGDTLRDGMHAVHPARDLDLEALTPDVLVVSHIHPDHFDLPSLDRLARRCPDAVVLTADPLVAACCARLGFAVVRVLEPWQVLDIGRLRLIPTPSHSHHVEWGLALATPDGVAWNTIDSGLGDLATARQMRDAVLEHAGHERLDFVALQWQPLLEVAAQTAERVGFPFDHYGRLLAIAAMLDARGAIPAAAGLVHLGHSAWLNAVEFPVDEARLVADLARAAPGLQVWPGVPGTRVRIASGEVGLVDPADHLVRVRRGTDPRAFDPLAIPELVDPNLHDRDPAALRAVVDDWCARALAPALSRPELRGLRLALEVVYPDGAAAMVFDVADTVTTRRGTAGWDVLVRVAGSQLADVVEGRRHWGEPLLSGLLRAVSRAYEPGPDGLVRRRLQPFFVYYALPYRTSVERATTWQLTELLAAR